MRFHNFAVSLVLWAIIIFVIFAAGTVVFGRDNGQYANIDPAIKKWIKELKNSKGENCCDTADGYPVEAENDTAKGHWRVRINGEWIVVHDEAVLISPNRLGYPMVWWYPVWESSKVMHPQIRCFLPGALL